MSLSYSNHAITRIQQRGIRSKDIEMIINVGTAIGDDSIILLNHDVNREIKTRKLEIEMLERLRSVRVVLSDDEAVITVYHTCRKIEKNILRGTHKHTSKLKQQ